MIANLFLGLNMQTEKLKVLAIDDEVINIQIIRDVLGDAYEVLFATRGAEGIEIARKTLPDLILLDVMMPDMDGFQVCERLKEDPLTAAIVVIFITGQDSTAQEIQGLEAGAIDYITKPIQRQVVQARVRNHLALKRSLQEPSAFEPGAGGETERISDRQREILEWIQAGKTNWEIASIIGSSEANVKYHIGKIMEKLDSHTRTQAVAKAVSLRIISLKK